MADKVTPGDWFLGRKDIDPGVDGWDGKVWAAPTPEEVAEAEAVRGTVMEFDPEPMEVATFASEADARLFLASREMATALEAVLMWHGGGWDALAWTRLTGKAEGTTRDLCDLVRAALAKAKGA